MSADVHRMGNWKMAKLQHGAGFIWLWGATRLVFEVEAEDKRSDVVGPRIVLYS